MANFESQQIPPKRCLTVSAPPIRRRQIPDPDTQESDPVPWPVAVRKSCEGHWRLSMAAAGGLWLLWSTLWIPTKYFVPSMGERRRGSAIRSY